MQWTIPWRSIATLLYNRSMSENIQFDEGQNPPAMSYVPSEAIEQAAKPSLIRLVRKFTIIRSDTQAYYILISIGIVSILLAACIFGYYVLGIGHARKVTSYISPGARALIMKKKTVRQTTPASIIKK